MALVCIFGLPGSGKTTLAARLKSTFFVHLFSLDEEPSQPDYHSFRKACEQKIRLFLQDNSQRIRSAREIVIVDDVLYLLSMRRPFLRMARAFGLYFRPVYVACGLDTCIARNSHRPSCSFVPESTICQIHKDLEVGPDAFVYTQNFGELVAVLEKFELPVPPMPSVHASEVDLRGRTADLISRAAVARLRSALKFDGKLMSLARKQFVRDCQFKSSSVGLEAAAAELRRLYSELVMMRE